MTLLARLFGSKPDPREALVPLWQWSVQTARDPRWYRDGGVADSVSGRFDMVVHVLALVMLRAEHGPDAAERTARLTELFVDEMDGQLREEGVGDVVVGKRVGKLMQALGGRIAALRSSSDDAAAREAAVRRNITFVEGGGDPALVVADLTALEARLAAADDAALLAGQVP
ncbi:ubiquinol-cytochrome C chaperone family protein [Parablastomonas sp. CN1-191]|uniref:ubiquinol-cytochrome C chaperone family protein n=1 Tax=Parablastomonas sp. CN1-191 TaxID=3400908 RepID=UPI003BF7BEB3